MRKPDISTYESWFLDFLEGNLSREEHALLKEFLDSHPVLAEELSEMEAQFLPEEALSYPHADSLLKSVGDLEGEAFEEYCIAAMEGDLAPDEQSAFEKSLKENSQKEKVYQQYQKTRLLPDNSIYANKSKLLKKQGAIRVLPWALPLAAAAALLLFILLPLNRNISSLSSSQISSNEAVQEKEPVEEPGKPAQAESTSAQAQFTPEPLLAKTQLPLPEKIINTEKIPLTQTVNKPVQREVLAWGPLAGVEQISLTNDYALRTRNLPMDPSVFVAENFSNDLSLWRKMSKEFRQLTQPETKVASDEPLKLREVADAGITGINKLLGWNVDFGTRVGDDQPDD